METEKKKILPLELNQEGVSHIAKGSHGAGKWPLEEEEASQSIQESMPGFVQHPRETEEGEKENDPFLSQDL